MKNYYEILGVDPDADENQIRRSAWLKIKKLNEVFLVLKNNYSRINYDFYLKYLEYIDPDAIFNNWLNYEALLNNNTEYNEYEDEHSDEENHKTYYEILGVDQDATKTEIKTAFRNLAKDYHPDSSNNSNTEEKFKEINETYHILNDEESRKNYDCYLEYFQEEEEFDDRWDYSSLLNEDYSNEHYSEDDYNYNYYKNSFETDCYYEILEVSHNATLLEVYIAFEDRKQEITDAYHTLRKKWKRKKYNWALEFSQMSSAKKLIFIHYLTSFIAIGISGVGYIIWRLYELFK